MAKFMNAELNRIRDNLTCGHCLATFKGSDSQAWKVKYEKKVVYCSAICRHSALRSKFTTSTYKENSGTPAPNRGPCGNCGKDFFSRTAKIYCSIGCYIKSDQFKAHLKGMCQKARAPEVRQKQAETLRKGETVPCLECGEEIYQQRHRRRKFCTVSCRRSYLAKRFDRWVANPEGMALPQCYDEFLDRDELPCPIDGCDWKGRHLTLHVNYAHGINSGDFKRAAGFNLSTGVIARPLAQLLQGREKQGVAIESLNQEAHLDLAREAKKFALINYKSLEGREHQQKARAMAGLGPERTCSACGLSFRQTSPFGKTLYCSISCRDKEYSKKRKSSSKVRMRDKQGRFAWAERTSK